MRKALKIVITAVLALVFFQSNAQIHFVYHQRLPQWFDAVKVDGVLLIPAVDTADYPASDYFRDVIIQESNKKVYYSDSTSWKSVGSGGGAAADSSIYTTLTRLKDSLEAVRADFPAAVDLSDYLKYSDTSSISSRIDGKVDKVSGKGLSTNDYTTAEKTKLSGIASGAEVNVQSDMSQSNSSSDGFIKNKNNNYLINGKGYINADSLQSHAATLKAPLKYNPADSSIGLDTSRTTGIPTRKVVDSLISANAGTGNGDMLKATYDPTGVDGDAFDYRNFTHTPTIPTNNNSLTNGKGYINSSQAASQINDSLENHPGADSTIFVTHTQANNTFTPLSGFNQITTDTNFVTSGTGKVYGSLNIRLNPNIIAVAEPHDTVDIGGGSGSGSVTSVALDLGSILFSITGSPVTGSGTLTGTLKDQDAGTVFSVGSSDGTPSFRALTSSDIPSLAASKVTSGVFNKARLGSGTASAGKYIDGGTGAWTTLPIPTFQQVGTSGNIFSGNISIGKSTAPGHTLDVGGSAQFDGYVNFGDGYSDGGATIDATGLGQFQSVGSAQVTTSELIAVSTSTIQSLTSVPVLATNSDGKIQAADSTKDYITPTRLFSLYGPYRLWESNSMTFSSTGDLLIVHYVATGEDYTGMQAILTPTSEDAAKSDLYVVKADGYFDIKAGTAPPTGTNNISFDIVFIKHN